MLGLEGDESLWTYYNYIYLFYIYRMILKRGFLATYFFYPTLVDGEGGEGLGPLVLYPDPDLNFFFFFCSDQHCTHHSIYHLHDLGF